jgi:hypothetical protein
VGRHSSDTTLFRVARPALLRRPAALGAVLAVVAVLMAGAGWLASRPGGGPALAERAAGSTGSPAAFPSIDLDQSATGDSGGGSPSGAATTRSPSPSRRAGSPSPSRSPSRSPAAPGAVLTAAFHRVDTWGDGYQAAYTITNHGTVPVSGWTVVVTFSGSGSVRAWDADATNGTNHQVTFAAKSYNRTVPAGGSVTFGMVVTGSPPPDPVACTVNGRPC